MDGVQQDVVAGAASSAPAGGPLDEAASFAGLEKGAKLSFYSYRDMGPYDETSVRIRLAGSSGASEYDSVLLWTTRGEDPDDHGWRLVELTLPYAWFWQKPVELRFQTSTQSAWDKTSHVGWLVDDIKITR